MAGIADNTTQPINTAPIAAIGSDPSVPPGLTDFMQAFRTGFITVDDLTRRTKQGVAETDALKTSLSANDLTRRKTAAELQLLPGQQAEAATQQQIQTATAPARVATATEQGRLAQLAISDPDALHAEIVDKDLHSQYISATGRPLPDSFSIKNPEKPLDYVDWVEAKKPEINARVQELQVQFPDGGEAYKAAMVADSEARYVEWQKYATNAEKIRVPKGSPLYAEELRKQVKELGMKSALSGAYFKAFEAGLKTAAEGGKVPDHETVKRTNLKTGMEETVRVQTDPRTGTVLSETILATNLPTKTEAQERSVLFAGRMAEADVVLNQLSNAGFDPAAASTTVQTFKLYPNRLRSDEVQQYDSARRSWSTAILRRDSGATITPIEKTEANKEYFPLDGDSPQEVVNKNRRRKKAEELMRGTSGPVEAAAVRAAIATEDSGVSGGVPAPTKLGDGTPVPVNSVWGQGTNKAKWDGLKWVPVQ